MNRKSFVIGIFTGIAIAGLIALLYFLGGEAIKRFSDVTNINRIGFSTAIPTTQSLESIAKQWNIIPIRVQSESESNGWVLITIDLAIENNSNEWGSLDIFGDALNKITLETAEGFTYNVHRGDFGSECSSFGIYVGTGHYWLSPGFRAKGIHPIGYSTFESLARLCFYVAENTTGYKVIIPQYKLLILRPPTFEPQEIEVDAPMILDLDTNNRMLNFPTALSGKNFNDFNSPFEFEGIGTVIVNTPIVKNNADSWTITLGMTFRNASAGYENWVHASVWTLGKKGIIYGYESLSLSAGPNQSSTGAIYLNFPLDDGNMKIFIQFNTANSTYEPVIFDTGTYRP